MRKPTIRETREGLSHLEPMSADADEVFVVRRGQPVARIQPVTARRRLGMRKDFLLQQPFQPVTSETLLKRGARIAAR